MKRLGTMTWLLKNLGVDDVVIGDLVEQHQAGRSRGWFWRQALTATLRAARTSALLTLGAAVLGWIVLWVFFGFLLVPLGQLDGYVVASGWAEQYSAGWWLRGIAMWIVMGFPFLASGWIVAKLAWRTPLLPILTFAASVSAVVLIALILDTGPTERFDLRVWLTVPLFLMVAPATAITVGGILAASSSKLNRFDAGR